MSSFSTAEKKSNWREPKPDLPAGSPNASSSAERVSNPLRDYILESARTIHRTELTMALLRWMLSVVALFFSLVLIDQWLWPLTSLARYIVWVGFIGGTVAWFATKVVPLIGRRIHP